MFLPATSYRFITRLSMLAVLGLSAFHSLGQSAKAPARSAVRKSGKAAVSTAEAPRKTAESRLSDPLQAQFYTTDITHFWEAFDAWQTGAPGNPFDELYWRKASEGTRILLDKNGIPNPDSLRAVVARRRADYEKCRATTLRMAETVPQCRGACLALKNLYPSATFPPVYFGIGGFLVGGNSVPQGLLIGAEMHELPTIRVLVAHEVVHSQQQIPYKYRVLLEQCLIEGGADFICELMTGNVATSAPHAYAKGREQQLWQEFERDQNLGEKDSFSLWLYGGDRPAGRPADLGYYIGYEICRAYYERATDKRQAVYDILHITDARDFLRRSAYADRFR